ncbi:MAG: chitobiase/beta-hexosaminidase C-terminal domain-containing protein [Lachnospiraceae bacterium]|nr:chitobiase/beta-hexosaminidase C-terminal domain-containing protein [Lachnospiraceae bacterium]
MRKIRKRVFASVLAAALLFTMPGMASAAVAEDAQTEDISESVTVLAADNAAEETGAKTEAMQESEAEDNDTNKLGTGDDDTGDTETDAQQPAEEETVPTQKEDTKECTCGTLCTEDSINGDCPVCGAKAADLSCCKGEKTENSAEENKEDTEQRDTYTEDASTNLCAHHKEHTQDCGYSRALEDGEGSPCTYECKLCRIEDLLAALPRRITENNAEEVRARLDEILDLYWKLTGEEQEQIDISCCLELQAALDAAYAPTFIEGPTEGDVAQVEIDKDTTYYDTIDDAWAAAKGKTATVTLLADVTASRVLEVSSGDNITFDGGSYTLTGDSRVSIDVHGGKLTLTSGTVKPLTADFGGIAVSVVGTGELVVIGGTLEGLAVDGSTVRLFGGEFTGGVAISCTSGQSLRSLLLNHGTATEPYYAYFDAAGKPVALEDGQTTLLGGTYTVKVCTNHVYQEQSYSHVQGSLKHTQTCAACGAVEEVDCEYIDFGATYNIKVCACGATLTASLTGADNLVYNGARQTPGATFMVDGITPREVANVKTYTYNKDAGTGTLAIIDVDGVFWGMLRLEFTIAKATPEITWNGGRTQTLTYTGKEAAVTADVQLVNNETGTVSYSYAKQGSDSYISGLPTDVGTYSVKASFAEQKNYVAAEAELTLIIAPLAITVTPDSGQHKEYGADDPELTYMITPSLIGDDKLSGALTYKNKEAGAIGNYEIIQGTLAVPSNYELTVTSGVMFEITRRSLEKATVTVNGDFTYDGMPQTPTADQVKVVLNGVEIPSSQYTISASDNINAGTATVMVTATENGGYIGSASKGFAIAKADVAKENLQYMQPNDSIYTGESRTASVTANGLTGIGQITVKYRKDNKGDFLTEAVEPGTYHVYAGISSATNYNDTQIEMGSFTISYMDAPELRYNGNEKKEYYSGDVAITAVPADGHTYTVSDAIGGGYQSSYTISAQEGTETKTLHFKDEDGHISDGVKISVNFDLTPPTGGIAIGAKWWQNVLNFITFGHYAVQDYTVTIKAEDKGGSGIGKIEYVIVTGSAQYDDAGELAAAGLSWTEYNNSKPTVSKNTSQYVVYARLTDKAGNVTYISTDGILLDSTPPTVDKLTVPENTIKDMTAGFTFTVSEAVSYYYVVLPQGSTAPLAEDIIVTCGGILPEGKTGTAIADAPHDSGTISADMLADGISVEAENLSPNTKYIVYVTAVDTAVDITNLEKGTPAGNLGNVVQADFTTKKTMPVITNAPTMSGIYGQSAGEMTVTGGTAKGGNTVLTGTWTVSSTDSGKTPVVGTTEEVTVIFTPDSDSYGSVLVKAIPKVSPRSLNADGVTVSEVAGTYTYIGSEFKPQVAVNTGTPASGIYISDSRAALTANDFTVSYSNNTNAGTASVTITGKGNYTGLVTRTFIIEKAPGRTLPDLTGRYTDDGQTYTYSIAPTEGAVYRKGEDEWTGGNEFRGIMPGTSVTFSAKMPENENYKEGEAKSITVNFPKLTPAAPALSYTRKTDRETGNITLTITETAGAEYSFDGGATWQDTAEQEGFDASQTVTLAIRLKETQTHNLSSVQKVTINLAKKDRKAPSPFTLQYEANEETDYTITIPPTEGCEYSYDGENWSDSNVKHGVKVGETVTGYKRYKETDEYNTSDAVSASKQMPKFTLKTPVITPTGGSYTGSVSVTITCGSPDAEVYYTTDSSTPTSRSARYTEAFTLTPPATVKAIAIKEGFTDSALATVSYTKQNSGGSGSSGSSGGGNGGEGESGSGSGDSGDNGGGDTIPEIPVIPPATNTNPGTDTEAVKPGTGNTVRPGTRAEPGRGSTEETRPNPGMPFIKGEDSKIGWNVIRAEEEQAKEGSIINVDMNGTAVVPGDIFDSIKGRDITITFDMGSGIIWSVNGKSITTDKAGVIDFSVKTGVSAVPVDIVNNVTGERYRIQMGLAYEGEFGFTAVLSINLGKENAGHTASLYYYNERTGELKFICSDIVAEDGTVSLAFTHASDCVISIDGDEEEESDSVSEDAQPEDTEEIAGSNTMAEESSRIGQAWRSWWFMIIGVLVIIMGIGVFFVVNKKRKGGDN